MATTRATLKQYFKKYATPTEAQFHELIDAFVHKDEDSLTQSKIDGLVAALDGKVSTNQVNTMVESKVSEILSDPNFAAAPTAHSHVAADVEGLSAFITRVTNFLDSADVSDTTINRWKEIETFLTGITDQETLTGLLLDLKNEITALIPAPAPTNYLKQIADLDAYTDAQEGEIVQYVGMTDEYYTKGFFYQRIEEEEPQYAYMATNKQTINGCREIIFNPDPYIIETLSHWAELPDAQSFISMYNIRIPRIFRAQYNGNPFYGIYFMSVRPGHEVINVNELLNYGYYTLSNKGWRPGVEGVYYLTVENDRIMIEGTDITDTFRTLNVPFERMIVCTDAHSSMDFWEQTTRFIHVIPEDNLVLCCHVCKDANPFTYGYTIEQYNDTGNTVDFTGYLSIMEFLRSCWQPIATSPVVSY